ncbi:MAG: LacI family transcriptional regulator [Actinobacteria bacterium]|nr:LacI family transcriptional regulator [Actinomycetota bacterium]MBM3712126.1 LacI family transcriptional regulator [Actinomycetota bacterium]
MVNIKFIAEKAGVSLRTVLNVLNNRDTQFNEETKKKVLDIIEKYQYLPNRIATEYLIKKGHTRILYMVGNEDLLAHRDRKKGYLDTLKKYGIEINKDYLIYSDFKDLKLYEKLTVKFKSLEGFTAIFSYDDTVAANCVKAVKRVGKRIPEDISIIAVNNSNFLNWLEPALTTIEQPINEICIQRIDLLLALINNKDVVKKSVNQFF